MLACRKTDYSSEAHETYSIRPSNGHSSPGINCPSSLCMRMTYLSLPGAPCYFIRGAYLALDCRAAPATPAREEADS
eukprot:2258109-Pyramimonas_sp.AAC.1